MKIVLTDANFEEEIKKSAVLVLVDFYADWCGPCKMMEPHVDQIEKELESKVIVAKLDVDANSATAGKFGVMSIPTTIIFKNGMEVKRMVGYQDKDSLVKAITQ